MLLQYLPNLITGLRIILVLPIVNALLSENWQLAFYLFLLAGLSDSVDGRLARHYGWTTHLGSLLDPIADKLLLISSFITFSWLNQLPWWLTATVVIRDFWIVSGALAYRCLIGPVDYHPVWVSKVNTVLQIVLILLLLVHLGFYDVPNLLLYGVGAGMFITTVISFFQYTINWSIRALRNKGHPL